MSGLAPSLRGRLGRMHTRQLRRLRGGDHVLDVGCGDGSWLAMCARDRTDLVLAGVDGVRPARVPGEISFHRMDLETGSLPYPDGTFQLVVCTHVLEHLAHCTHILGEMVRVLAPAGLLYLETPSRRTLRAPRAPAWLEPRVPLAFHDEPTHVGEPRDPAELAALLADAGLAVEASGRARTAGGMAVAGPRLGLGLVARDGRALASAIEQLAGLHAWALGRRPAGQ